jgi:hypothetical protein
VAVLSGGLFRARTIALLAVVATAFLLLAMVARPPKVAAAQPGLIDRDILEVYDDTLTVTEDGAVIENLEIRGTLRIQAFNVTVRNVWVYTTASWTVHVASGSATFENMEIGHPGFIGERGIGGSNITARDLYIHDVEDGIKLGSNSFYDRIVVEHLDSPNESPHGDALQADGGAMNSTVQNSVLDSTGPMGLGNSAVILKSDLGPIANITMTGNYFNGGNYTIFVRDGGYGMPSGVAFNGNRFGSESRYGLLSTDGEVGWVSNVWAATGEPAEVGSAAGPPGTGTTAVGGSSSSTAASSTTSSTSAPSTSGASSSSAAPTTTVAALSTEASIATTASQLEDGTAAAVQRAERSRIPTVLLLAGLALALLLMFVLARRIRLDEQEARSRQAAFEEQAGREDPTLVDQG